MKKLAENKSFHNFNLDLTNSELNNLSNLHINFINEYNNFGNLNSLAREVKEFAKIHGNDEKAAPDLADLVLKLTTGIVKGNDSETAWVALRAFTKTSKFNYEKWKQ